MLSVDGFLALFPEHPPVARDNFTKEVTCKYARPMSLHTFLWEQNKIIKSDSDYRIVNRDAIVDALYRILVVDRKYHLELMYKSFLELDESWMTKTSEYVKTDKFGDKYISLQVQDRGKNLIQNLFFIDLYHKTKVTNVTRPELTWYRTMYDIFVNFILPDRALAPTTCKVILEKPHGDTYLYHMMQQYLPKASVLNPYIVARILENACKWSGVGKMKLCSMVLSWGVYAYIASRARFISEYVGIDVMKSVCDKVDATFVPCNDAKCSTLCCQSEMLTQEWKDSHKNYFDCVIICPPYYDVEVYPEGKQSISEYHTYEEWLERYIKATINNSYEILKVGGVFLAIVNNYTNLGKRYYPLVDDFKARCTQFKPEGSMRMMRRAAGFRTVDKTPEQLLLYRKIS